MKKSLTAVLLLVTIAVTALPISTASASVQTVECSWWGKMVNGDYYKGKEGKKRLEQQRRWQEQQRRQREQQRRQEEQRRRQQQRY